MNSFAFDSPQQQDRVGRSAASPLYATLALASRLQRAPHKAGRLSVVHAAGPAISAWAARFRDTASAEAPLLYLLSAATSAQLFALASESRQRGIFCNDIETRPSAWPKGVHPSAPLWLMANRLCKPFDPASGEEARVILLNALQALYVDGQPGFYYLALHDEPLCDEQPYDQQEAPHNDDWHSDACKGMYRCAGQQPTGSALTVTLLGAGRLLQHVRSAARLLHEDWAIGSQVWSCPSYTLLARDAEAAQRWNRLHPTQPKRLAHLQRCLGDSPAPIIAVSGYGQHIVEQLAQFLTPRFVGLGSESLEAGAARHWIAVSALKALADDGHLPHSTVRQAMQRYALA